MMKRMHIVSLCMDDITLSVIESIRINGSFITPSLFWELLIRLFAQNTNPVYSFVMNVNIFGSK